MTERQEPDEIQASGTDFDRGTAIEWGESRDNFAQSDSGEGFRDIYPPAETAAAGHLLAALDMLLGDQEVTGVAGNGAVQVAMKFDIAAGMHPISGVRIDPALLQPEHAGDLSALLVEAANAAQAQALELAEEAINDAVLPDEDEAASEDDQESQELLVATEHLAETTRLAREVLGETMIAGQAGGGAARVIMSASGEFDAVYLRLDLLRPDRAMELEQAFIEAYNDASAQAQMLWQDIMLSASSAGMMPEDNG